MAVPKNIKVINLSVVNSLTQELATAKLGAGYRISLSRDTKLDFIAAVRLTHTHPQIIDEGDLITLEWTNRNSAFLAAVSVGMSLTF